MTICLLFGLMNLPLTIYYRCKESYDDYSERDRSDSLFIEKWLLAG